MPATFPTKTDGSIGRGKSNAGAITDINTQLTAPELEKIKDRIIEYANELGDTDGSTPGSVWEILVALAKHKLDATVDPVDGDDIAAGYSIGSIWVNTVSGNALICTDPSIGAAVWTSITAGAAGSAAWGSITGTLSAQTDLQTELDAITASASSHAGNTSNPHSVTKAQVGLGDVTNIKNNLSASATPGATDDSGSGYSVLSRWADTTADKEYVCLGASVGAAVWKETTQQPSGGGAMVALQFAGRVANAGINTYVQNSGAAPWDYTGLNQTRSGAQGAPASPGTGSCAGSTIVPFDGTITKITGWINAGVNGNTGDLELWRWRATDDAYLSTATGVQVNGAQLEEFGTAAASNNSLYFEINNPANGSVNAGDLLEPLVYVDGSTLNGAGHFGFTVVVEPSP